MKETFVYTVEIYEIMRNVNTAYLHHSSGLFLLLFIPTEYKKSPMFCLLWQLVKKIFFADMISAYIL